MYIYLLYHGALFRVDHRNASRKYGSLKHMVCWAAMHLLTRQKLHTYYLTF